MRPLFPSSVPPLAPPKMAEAALLPFFLQSQPALPLVSAALARFGYLEKYKRESSREGRG